MVRRSHSASYARHLWGRRQATLRFGPAGLAGVGVFRRLDLLYHLRVAESGERLGGGSAPLVAVRRYRCYETHKLPSGDVFVIGFAKPDVARTLSTATDEMTLQIHPQPEGDFETLVTIPYSRIRHHRQYAAPNQDGFTVTVKP